MKNQDARHALSACNEAATDALSAAERLAEFIAELDAADLPDIGARIKRAADKLAEADKACKARIMSEADGDTLRGASFTARIVESVRWTLDSAAVKSEMGEDWYTARSKCAHVQSVRYAV